MPKLTKRMPRFVRRARQQYSAPTDGASPALWAHLLAQRTTSGIAVDPQSSLGLLPYLCGVRVISEDVASLPIAVYRRRPRGGTKLIKDHPITVRFDRSPDGDAKEMASLQWRESWVAHTLGWGNGYSEIEWSNAGEPLGFHLMHPGRTEAKRDTLNRLYYQQSGAKGPQKIPPANVLHLAWLGFNGLTGYSPVSLAREAIGLGRAAESFGASLFLNGAIPKGFLKTAGTLKPEAIANLRESWNAVHQGSTNANKVAILEQGLDFVPTQINPDDAQFLATRHFQVIEIARLLRLPPHKLADYTQSHLANIEAANLDYLMTTLRPWCVRIEQCFDLKLLTDEEKAAGFYTRHDIRALLRANIADRAKYYQTMFQFGMSPDEIRELEDMNPIGPADGGDLRFRPLQMVELDAQAAPPGAPAAPDVPDQGRSGDSKGADTAGDAGFSGPISGRQNGRFSHENAFK